MDAGNLWVWNAWLRLTDERQWQTRGSAVPMGGMIITPFPARMPWQAVRKWCEAKGYDEEREDFLDKCLMAMESVYLAWFAEQMKQKAT